MDHVQEEQGRLLDEIAELLDVPVEEFNTLACSGETIHAISGTMWRVCINRHPSLCSCRCT